MKAITILLILVGTTVMPALNGSGHAADALKELEQRYRHQATAYKLFRDPQHTQQLVLADAPVYKWTDAQAKGRTGGMVFIWTWQGRPEAIAAIFSNPVGTAQRRITHEFHSLSQQVLHPETNKWRPTSGIKITRVTGAPDVAGTATGRLVQMRSIARRFTAHTVDRNNERWEMRFLPQPLFRHPAATTGAVTPDGAVFAFVTSELTDPEVILLLETMPVNGVDKWGFALVRLSGFPTYVRYNGEDFWNSIPRAIDHNEDHTYRLIQQPLVEETWR